MYVGDRSQARLIHTRQGGRAGFGKRRIPQGVAVMDGSEGGTIDSENLTREERGGGGRFGWREG